MRILKFFVLSSVIFFSSLEMLFSQTISRVVLEGVVNVREGTVHSNMKLRRGVKFDQENVREDIETLVATGQFESVEISFDETTRELKVVLKERPFVKKIEFRGNKRFSVGRLKDEITIQEKTFLDRIAIMESESKILSLYSDKGYADCSVETVTSTDEKNRLTINFLITEGNRVLIEDTVIKGTKVFSERKIKSLMETRKNKVYKQETIDSDIRKIENFYKNRGYQEVAVSKPEVVFNEDRTRMTILLIISEGVRYKIGEITFSGNSAYTHSELRKQVPFVKGHFYNEEKFGESISNINALYSDKGYLRVQIDPQIEHHKETGVMDINYSITEGEMFYLGYIDIVGLTHTQENVIRREILLKEGEALKAGNLRRSLEKIHNLGFLESVEPEIRPTQKTNEVDLLLNITEGKPGIFTAGAGFSSVDQLVGTLQVQHANLFGRAQRLSLMWEFGARKHSYEISWTDPWFFDRPMSFGIDAFNTERLRSYGVIYSAYRESRMGGAIRVGPRFSDILSLLFSYSYEDIELFDIKPEVIAAGVEPSRNVTSSLSSQIIRDTRDNIFDASRGSRNSLMLQYAGGILGGDINYIKSMARSSWFFPTFWKFVLSTNLQLGWMAPFSPSTDVPIYERFHVGGAETIRGYRARGEIGPPEGGKAMMVLNVEYKFPIVQEKNRTILQGAFFYDIGAAWRDANDIVLNAGMDDRELKSGVGFGIRITTPIFPIRLDWGYGLNHKPGHERSHFYFTLGQIF